MARLLTSVILAVFCASTAAAPPRPATTQHATHNVRHVTRDLKIKTFHPPSTFETFGTGIGLPSGTNPTGGLEDLTIAFVSHRLSIDPSTVNFRTASETETVTHAFLTQKHNGIPFANAVANMALGKDNMIVSFGSSFVKPTSIASSTPRIKLEDAISTAEETIGGKFNGHPPTLEYLAKEDNSAVLTHVVQIQNRGTGAWVEAFVNAHTRQVVSVTDFVAQASYRALPIWKQAVPQGFEIVNNPQDTVASPSGWHTIGNTNTIDTSGNNVIAAKGNNAATTRQSAPGLVFNYPQDPSRQPTVQTNLDAARVNNFYVVNVIHDFTYRYGFTEATFNFQQVNFNKGGAQRDGVIVSVQDGQGFNNAFFSTPPDGQSGYMTMFMWNFVNPWRDGSVQNDIIVHEMTHGVTNRMTGGGTGRCLQTLESAGMGEGWGDALADWSEKTSAAVPDFGMFGYLGNRAAGFRHYMYSTNPNVNPLTYQHLQSLNEAHDIGEVWANMLHNVYAALVGTWGWDPNARTNPNGTAGNNIWLHLFLDALLLQPCNPTFIQARDAWIQADQNRYRGANTCILWGAFASRGLGVEAADYINDYTLPAGC